MSDVYSKVLLTNQDARSLQKSWLKNRKDCIKNTDYETAQCLIENYNNQISLLLGLHKIQKFPITKENVCDAVTNRSCNPNLVEEFIVNSGKGFAFDNVGQTFIVITDANGHIDYEGSWAGHPTSGYRDMGNDWRTKTTWSQPSELLPEHILVHGGYRAGCPDCGTRDYILVRSGVNWAPLNLFKLYNQLGLITQNRGDTYMKIDDKTGIVSIRVEFDDFKASSAQGYASVTANGKIVYGIFEPIEFKVTIPN